MSRRAKCRWLRLLPLLVLSACAQELPPTEPTVLDPNPLAQGLPDEGPGAHHDVFHLYPPDEVERWHQEYLRALDPAPALAWTKEYPGTLRDLRATTRGDRERGLGVCGVARDVRALPFVVELLDDPEASVRSAASLALVQLVEGRELPLRAPAPAGGAAIPPRKEGDADPRSLRWVLLHMLSHERSAPAAATAVGYLGLEELVPALLEVAANGGPLAKSACEEGLRLLSTPRAGPDPPPSDATHDASTEAGRTSRPSSR